MTRFIDFETALPGDPPTDCDLLIIGGGAAGLTLAREQSGSGIRVILLESGGLEETAEHEALNEVEGCATLQDQAMRHAREAWHGPQMKFWSAESQQFGVRCRALGGSTNRWAGKVAPFEDIDFSERAWIDQSGWPFGLSDVAPYIGRGAKHLGLGSLVHDEAFWSAAGLSPPEETRKIKSFRSCFWQFARSRHAITDVMRFGPEFQKESHPDTTVIFNATACALRAGTDRIEGAEIVSSLTGKHRLQLSAPFVVLAASAIENARLLLLSKDASGAPLGNRHDVVGRYLTDHPSLSLGTFSPRQMERASSVLGFFALREGYDVHMYSHGLVLREEVQQREGLPHMAIFAGLSLAQDDPLLALKRLVKRQTAAPLKDAAAVLKNIGFVVTSAGRKILEHPRLPRSLKKLVTNAAILLNAKFVALNYAGSGRGRRLESVSLHVICEQPPVPENRITLSDRRDRLGLPLARVDWEASAALSRHVVKLARLLAADLEMAGLNEFNFSPEILSGDFASLIIHDMAHTAGTTRMGRDPHYSVVNPDCQVHDVPGLYVAGASVFPTSGHANPTLMILALAIRMADHLKAAVTARKVGQARRPQAVVDAGGDAKRPLILVTGATGNLGREVVDELARNGYRIRALCRANMPDDERAEWHVLDFADPDLQPEAFAPLLSGVDGVIHLAASLSDVTAMETVNVTNLARFAQACADNGVRYFGQASSMVVYGSPRAPIVTETSPLIDISRPIHRQYFAEPYMRAYAVSKIRGEEILAQHADRMCVDIYRIAVAQGPGFLDSALQWSRQRRLFSLYRNSHFIASREAARAMVHLLNRGLQSDRPRLEVYNICDSAAPRYTDLYRQAGRRPELHIPLLLDVAKGVKIGRTLSTRRPMGAFRLDDRKLRATGFVCKTATTAK